MNSPCFGTTLQFLNQSQYLIITTYNFLDFWTVVQTIRGLLRLRSSNFRACVQHSDLGRLPKNRETYVTKNKLIKRYEIFNFGAEVFHILGFHASQSIFYSCRSISPPPPPPNKFFMIGILARDSEKHL